MHPSCTNLMHSFSNIPVVLLAADVVRRVEAALGGQLDAAPQIHTVRDVAPNKLMLCVSFRVPAGVAFAGRVGAAHTAAAAAAGGTPGVTEQPSQLQQQQASKKPRLDS
jgi:hypothetical protein